MVLPPLQDPLYGFQAVNVESQAKDQHSLLNWMRRILSVRKRSRAFGRGALGRCPDQGSEAGRWRGRSWGVS